MKYAVVSIRGNQYKISPGDEILVEGNFGEVKKDIELTDVLLAVDGAKVSLGTPKVKGAKVAAEILNQEKGKKLKVFKYKAKSRYRRTMGHRREFSRLRISKISSK